MLWKQLTYARLEHKIYVIKYHAFWPALNIMDATRPLLPQVQIQLYMLQEIKAVLLSIHYHKIASAPINAFNL